FTRQRLRGFARFYLQALVERQARFDATYNDLDGVGQLREKLLLPPPPRALPNGERNSCSRRAVILLMTQRGMPKAPRKAATPAPTAGNPRSSRETAPSKPPRTALAM